MQNSLAERQVIDRFNEAAKYGYVFLSLMDYAYTILDRTLVGTPEATPVYRQLMAFWGDGLGFAISLSFEYLLIFGLHRILPKYLKPVPFFIPAYIHCMGALAHYSILTHQLPQVINDLVWANVNYLNSLGQMLEKLISG